jgi:energy-coupling factor transport system permease protein
MVILYSIIAFMIKDLVLMLFLLGFTLPILMLSNLMKDILRAMKGLSFLFFFILILNTYFTNFNFALVVCLRIIILMTIFSVYFQTTLPEDFMQALISMHISYSTAFAIALAFRFVPTMATETEIITEAQKSRGHRIEEGGIIQQIRNLFPLLIPLILNSIRRAYNVAEALEARGFGAVPNRTVYFPIKFSKRDWVFIIYIILFFTFSLLIILNIIVLPVWVRWNLTL